MPARSAATITKFALLALAIAGLIFAVTHWQGTPAPEDLPPPPGVATDPSKMEFYQRRVQPILRANCYRCHAGFLPKGGLRLDSQAGIFHGGKHGSVLTPGHAEESKIVIAIRHTGSTEPTKPMPPKSKLTDADIATVAAWINAGAIMPKDSGQ